MSSPARPPSLVRRLLPALALTGVSGTLIALLDHPSNAPVVTAPDSTFPARTTTPALSPGEGQPPSVAGSTTAPVVRSASCTGPLVDGPTIDTRWGPVQIAAIVATDGTLCDVEALQYPNQNRRSSDLNQRVLPVLHDRALSEGTSFDAVSGATVTSEGYRASLQAVLDH